MQLTRDAILAAQDRPVEEFPVPEWDGSVCLRLWSAAQRERWEKLYNDEGPEGARSKLQIRAATVALSVCDQAGNLIFTEADILALCEKSGEVLYRIWEAVMRLNKLLKSDVEKLEKNSETSPSDGSASGSP